MISNQLALIKRELWEHRSVYVTPIAISVVLLLGSLTGMVTASSYGAVVDLAMIGAHELGTAEHRAILTGTLTGLSFIFVIAMWIMIVFYSLDSLYAERKNKSILFWRSLPVTDAETVVSKLLVAALVVPLFTFAVVVVTHLVSLILGSIWLNFEGGSPGLFIWQSINLFDLWTALLIFIMAVPVWLSPFIGWFLFVSAWTKRSPFLVASMPIIVVPLVERTVFGTTFLMQAIWERTGTMPLFGVSESTFEFFELEDFALEADSISLLALIDLGKFLSSPSMWAGLLVCGLFVTGAIYVRRFRDES